MKRNNKVNEAEQKAKELANDRVRIAKEDENGKKKTIPKQYLNKKIWTEVTDEEVFKHIYSRSEQFCLEIFDSFWYFVKVNNKKFNNVPEYIAEKIKIMTENEKLIEKITKKKVVTLQEVETMTIFELKDFIETQKELEKQEQKKGDK